MRAPKDIAGWPEQNVIPLPLELTQDQRPIYEEAWSRFRDWLKLTPARSDPKGGLVENLRYRQKSSLLKVESMIDNVVDFVEGGNQVFISVEFIETMEAYLTRLRAKGIKCSEISGRNVETRDQERISFQKGETQVVVCTVVAGISLHAGESLPDGSTASSTPRITVIHDIRQNNLDTTQALGRAHRDGMHSVAYIPFFEETVDSRVVYSFVNKNSNMQAMTGASLDDAESLEAVFRQAVDSKNDSSAD
jgi:superfamily II DNA/RNA helicase